MPSVSVYAQTCINYVKIEGFTHIIFTWGQTDAEVFVRRNIDILSICAAILYLFQFQNKMAEFLFAYLSLQMRGIKSL